MGSPSHLPALQVNKERQFGFILYGEDQLLPSVPTPVAVPGEGAAAEDALANGGSSAARAPAQEGSAAAEGQAGESAPAAPAAEGSGEGAGDAAPAVPAAPAGPPAKRTRLFFHFKEVGALLGCLAT